MAPARPAMPHQIRLTTPGTPSPVAAASTRNPIAPTSCAPMTTSYPPARFVATPPQKSPAPHEAADASPNAAEAHAGASPLSCTTRFNILISRAKCKSQHGCAKALAERLP